MSTSTMAPARILVVEDQADVAGVVAYDLARRGYRVRTADDGLEAIHAVTRDCPDLIILDLMLPGVSGFEVLSQLRARAEWSDVPVIVLSALREEHDRLKGLELGCDDYVTKPFSPSELALRVAAVLRRTRSAPRQPAGAILRAGPIAVDLGARRVTVSGQQAELTPTEYRLLVTLLERRGRIQSRRDLLAAAWGVHAPIETRTVDIHVRRLRRKLGTAASWIETIRGFGYRVPSTERPS